ncbi:plasmalemma vesicle-associated protein [Bufo bufo]|uniref:plasmalemma vesicle-associated protein n=1 Tax=Bufo bufo TaxID=8384 RepID=UPI001ABE7979|nr:plasmalemma vesicle-associated protein [Bufo bufo]
MDPNYAMAKFGLESKDIFKSKNRGCWYYTKYFFFFLSIIQFLIILGLVLFMLYGNAHVGTEQRLMSVENRYKNLTTDYSLLMNNFSQMKGKVASLEKENNNCSNLLTTALKQLHNKTIGRPVLPMPPSPAICNVYQFALDRCNTTYIIETLQLKHTILMLQRDLDRLKENCGQTIGTLTNKVSVLTSEKEKLQNMKEDLETHAKLSNAVCTNINQRFDMELERMKNRFEGMISSHEPFHVSKCWTINGEIKNNIDQTINRLKQDVNNVMFENSQLKTDNARVSDNFQKCSQEKMVITSEKNNLSIEKGGLEKQLTEKKEELSTTYSKYMKKEEELENCRKVQIGGRVTGGLFPRS